MRLSRLLRPTVLLAIALPALAGRQYVAVAARGNAAFGYRQGDAPSLLLLPRPR
jgi:hypothetical protein